MADIEELERRLDLALPEPNEDGTYGDGSHEVTANLFERAYDRAERVAREAIDALRELQENN